MLVLNCILTFNKVITLLNFLSRLLKHISFLFTITITCDNNNLITLKHFEINLTYI